MFFIFDDFLSTQVHPSLQVLHWGRHIFAFEPDQGLYENKLASLISRNPPSKKTLQFLDSDDDCDEHVMAVDMDCDIGALL